MARKNAALAALAAAEAPESPSGGEARRGVAAEREMLWLRYAARLTGIVSRQLPDCWNVVQVCVGPVGVSCGCGLEGGSELEDEYPHST